MGNIHLTHREKKLLNAIGRNPDSSMEELLSCTGYKWASTVMKKLEQLKKQFIYSGSTYDLNYEKLCKNPLHKLECIIETDQSYETVITYLKMIESLLWIFPVLSPYKSVLLTGFLSSDDTEMIALFQLLKDNGIISDYIVHTHCSRRIVENPDFFGDPNPSLEGLQNPCGLPDMSLGCHDTVWNECDIMILPYMRAGYEDVKLLEILREEKKLHSRSWTYEEVKYSRDKVIKNGLIEKKYAVFPFPFDQSTQFNLFLQSEDITLTQRILCNFAKEERVYKEYALCEEWGMIYCVSHPSFVTDLMYKLDQIDEIKEKEMYQIRTNPPVKYSFSRFPTYECYDVENQVMKYPYHVYREKIKETLECG